MEIDRKDLILCSTRETNSHCNNRIGGGDIVKIEGDDYVVCQIYWDCHVVGFDACGGGQVCAGERR